MVTPALPEATGKTANPSTNRGQQFADQVHDLSEQFRLLIAEDQVVELRALHVSDGRSRPFIVNGYFDGAHLDELARAALGWSSQAQGTYFTINPLNPALLARRAYRVDRAGQNDGAKDKDVVWRRRLLIDTDPVRPTGIGATDEEKAKAYDVTLKVRGFLRGRQWPDPLLNDSGNGYHLIYYIDIPAEDSGLVKDVLAALSKQFDTEYVKIDQSVHNPARICKLPGTWSRKGDNVPDRPHRLAKILERPECMQVVPKRPLKHLRLNGGWSRNRPKLRSPRRPTASRRTMATGSRLSC